MPFLECGTFNGLTDIFVCTTLKNAMQMKQTQRSDKNNKNYRFSFLPIIWSNSNQFQHIIVVESFPKIINTLMGAHFKSLK